MRRDALEREMERESAFSLTSSASTAEGAGLDTSEPSSLERTSLKRCAAHCLASAYSASLYSASLYSASLCLASLYLASVRLACLRVGPAYRISSHSPSSWHSPLDHHLQ